jgi:hypothetical protein
MDLLVAWLIFPLVALALCGGIGLLVDRVTAGGLPGPLVPGTGLCGLVVVTQLTTTWSWSARATIPVAVALGVAGAVAGRERLRGLRPDGWAIAAAIVTFSVAGAPVVLSGEATFAGYTVLADTSVHVSGADALLDRGRDFSGLPPSSYQGAIVSYYNGSAYPAGAPTALGTIARLVGEDPLWTFAPFMALLLGQLALAFYALAGTALPRGALRAAVAAIAAQPAIVVTYALQGSIKEVGAASLIGLLAALVPWYVDRREAGAGPRAVVVLAVVTAAASAVVGAVALTWTAPLLAAAIVIGARRAPQRGRADVWASAAIVAVLVAAFSLQTLNGLRTYLDVTNSGRTPEARTGNLKQPLSPAQSLGVWLRGDHRDRPDGPRRPATIALQALLAATALAGAVLLARRGIWAPPLLLAVMAVATVLLASQGTSFSDAKTYMIASPAPLLVSLLAAALVLRDRAYPRAARFGAAGVAAALAVGVVASNAFAYREASLAPRDRLAELEWIAERFRGQGPVLTPEYEEFGKYVLRDLAPESPVEGWRSRPLQLANPDAPPELLGFSVEVGQLADAYVRQFPLLVLRRGFTESRAPAGYRRVHAGRWYDVWRREDGRAVLDVLSLGSRGIGRQAASIPACADVRRLAATAVRAGGELAYVERPATPVHAPGRVEHSLNWLTDAEDGDAVILFGPGRAQGAIRIEEAGRYDVWMEARVGRPAEVLVDGRAVGSVAWRMNPRRSAERVGAVGLAVGRHDVEVRVGGGGLRPGSAGVNRIIGPVGFVRRDPASLPVRRVSPDRWRALCGRTLDWVAAVGPAR